MIPPSDSRIALVHALDESVRPAQEAFARLWPEARCFDLLDTSLSADRAQAAGNLAAINGRIAMLADYARDSAGVGGRTAGILFTCSAFGDAIDATKRGIPIPILRPNEAAFSAALELGSRFLIVVSFEPSAAVLEQELRAMADDKGSAVSVDCVVARGALDALRAGDGASHDGLVAEAVRAHCGSPDAILLGQFSMARARATVEASAGGLPVITTPDSAVRELRRLVAAKANPKQEQGNG